MGINRQTFQLMLLENQFKELAGDFLCIGKQTVNVELNDIVQLMEDHQLDTSKVKSLISDEKFDSATRHGNQSLYDHDLLSALSPNLNYHCLDRSDYEGADIIQDMNEPLSAELVGKFDAIYNGSCMDNIFNPVSFLQNTTHLLKPGGRIIHIECASSVAGAYLMYSPEWFFSYYSINEFRDCKVYVTVARDASDSVYKFKTDLYEWKPDFTRGGAYNYIDACKSINGLMHVIVVAEKGENSTANKSPIQMQYLDENAVDWRVNYQKFVQSARPKLKAPIQKEQARLPLDSDHFIYLGSGF